MQHPMLRLWNLSSLASKLRVYRSGLPNLRWELTVFPRLQSCCLWHSHMLLGSFPLSAMVIMSLVIFHRINQRSSFTGHHYIDSSESQSMMDSFFRTNKPDLLIANILYWLRFSYIFVNPHTFASLIECAYVLSWCISLHIFHHWLW